MTATHTPLSIEPTAAPMPAESRDYTLHLSYSAGASADFELPEGKTWEDVDYWHVKWDTLYLTLKDGTEVEIQLAISGAEIDYKRPTEVDVVEDDITIASADD